MITVLVVEDDSHKAEKIQQVIASHGASQVCCECVGDSTGAIQWLSKNICDVMVLDLCIPIRPGGEPSPNGGESVVRRMMRGDSGCSRPKYAMGLTAFKEVREQFQGYFDRESWPVVEYVHEGTEWAEALDNLINRAKEGKTEVRRSGLILPLHGIRTLAEWHKALADVAQSENWICPVHRMWYGRFSLFQFLSPFARNAKVAWFREAYSRTMDRYEGVMGTDFLPSVVAHSFGTVILGNALVRFRDIKVDKVILCGCILPRDFPWKQLIENGQVQSVLLEIADNDVWANVCGYIVPGTGSSGRHGFDEVCEGLVQERHHLSHSEFFDERQMRKRWFPFLNSRAIQRASRGVDAPRVSKGDHPRIAMILSVVTGVLLLAASMCVVYVASKCSVVACEFAWDCSVRVWLSMVESLGSWLKSGGA